MYYSPFSAVVSPTLCTARFNIQKVRILGHTMYLCFVRMTEQTAIISLYSIN